MSAARDWSESGRRLRRLREQRGMTQAMLAEASGVPQPTLSLIESGARRPRSATRAKLAKALKLSVEQLDERVEPDRPGAVAFRHEIARRLFELACEAEAELEARASHAETKRAGRRRAGQTE